MDTKYSLYFYDTNGEQFNGHNGPHGYSNKMEAILEAYDILRVITAYEEATILCHLVGDAESKHVLTVYKHEVLDLEVKK